jgi:hypothetical protein
MAERGSTGRLAAADGSGSRRQQAGPQQRQRQDIRQQLVPRSMSAAAIRSGDEHREQRRQAEAEFACHQRVNAPVAASTSG